MVDGVSGTALSATLEKALNAHAAEEMHSSQLYLSASFWFANKNYDGIAGFLLKESEEERSHALKIYDYVLTRCDGRADVLALPKPKNNWETPQEVFRDLFEAEKEFSLKVRNLRSLALQEKDQGAHIFLDWFVQEQERAVDEWDKLNSKMQAYAALPGLLWHLDKELE